MFRDACPNLYVNNKKYAARLLRKQELMYVFIYHGGWLVY